MKKFCHNCGNEMSKLDAKFCPDCGVSLGSLNAKPIPPQEASKVNPTFLPFGIDGDNDDEYVDHISHYHPKINALDLEVRGGFAPPQETVAGVIKEEFHTPSSAPLEKVLARPQTISDDKAIEAFRQEAGTLRK